MGIYDEYGYLGIQIKINANDKRYRLGDDTPLSSGLYFSHEGVAVIDGFELVAVYPYDKMWDKWGGWIGEELKAIITEGNPVKVALDSIEPDPDRIMSSFPGKTRRDFVLAEAREFMDLLDKTAKEVEAEMKEERGTEMEPYWMVHRRGKQSGAARHVHHELSGAVVEAKRLARKEVDCFTILEAVMRVKPEQPKPVEVTVEAVGAGPLLGGVADEPPECAAHEPDEWCDDCLRAAAEALAPLYESDAELTSFQLERLRTALDEAHGLIPKSPCPCGCTEQADPNWCPHCGTDVVVERPEYPEPLGEAEAELRREWMPEPSPEDEPEPTADLSSSYAGWEIEDFENALANNQQARSDLCAGLKATREPERAVDMSDWVCLCGHINCYPDLGHVVSRGEES